MESQNPYHTPEQAVAQTPAQPYSVRTFTIKRIDPISTGSVMGGLYALIGLLIGGMFSLMALLGATVSVGEGEVAAAGFITGIGALILIPIFYGFLGFIGGLIGALIYNFVAGVVGGIRVDLEG